jgi:hypothetical protein
MNRHEDLSELRYSVLHLSKTIGLTTKFLRFLKKISFYFLTTRIQLSFNNVCSINIYDLSPTLCKRKDPTFVELLGLLAEEIAEVHFEVAFVVEFFFRANDRQENGTNSSQWEPSLENTVDVEPQSIRASIVFHALTLQCEVWHCHVKNKPYPAFPGVLLQLCPIADSRDQH